MGITGHLVARMPKMVIKTPEQMVTILKFPKISIVDSSNAPSGLRYFATKDGEKTAPVKIRTQPIRNILTGPNLNIFETR